MPRIECGVLQTGNKAWNKAVFESALGLVQLLNLVLEGPFVLLFVGLLEITHLEITHPSLPK